MSAEKLAELLSAMKARSGRTYEALGRRTGMSRSSVHRYCRGEVVPDSYGTIERIARACGATPAELAELYRHWQAALARTTTPAASAPAPPAPSATALPGTAPLPTAPVFAPHENASPAPLVSPTPSAPPALPATAETRDTPGTPGTGTPRATAPGATVAGTERPGGTASAGAAPGIASPRSAEPEAVAPANAAASAPEEPRAKPGDNRGDKPGDRAGKRGRGVGGTRASRVGGRHWRRYALVGAVLVVAGLTFLAVARPLISDTRPPAQWVTGPAWTLPAAPVPSTLFGVTLNSATGAMPAFRVGAVRLWDSETRWAQIQPRRGEYDWTVLDRQVSGAERAELPALFVMGGTPAWASPDGPAAPYPDGSRAAPPDDLVDWDAFVRSVAQRYRGRIEAYELWVLGNDRRFYTGSAETLVEMTRRANAIIKDADPEATVVCPGMGLLWTEEGRSALRRFAELHGYDHCDVAGIKLYQRTASDPPETMLELTATVDREFHRAGIHPRLWNTGTTYSIPLEGPLDDITARNYAVRFFLVGVYARKVNLERMYFYNWGGSKIPIVLQAEGGTPTRAALAVEQAQRWLAHAESLACGNGTAINLPENVWRCDFTVLDGGRRRPAEIVWTSTGTAEITIGPKAERVRRLDGSGTPVQQGDTLVANGEPIMIEHAP
ncbi:hypothetical protein Misp01_23160 [Microtetraspora sp. NBRC 13810]|uniref:helix-turn-helix domain-containing protein n=1 Tax=Microtetraspora sp. NBRC 13810 TaxID=3030990 RepID=UPI0024A3D96D|nr:helix-turn-helix domain-containing protein [Microtetraspora sp. NBRC 13810]GLW07186.1 hypothetical protein Misp01_23160 [Microtetraspora sp. NBRC 13810]